MGKYEVRASLIDGSELVSYRRTLLGAALLCEELKAMGYHDVHFTQVRNFNWEYSG